MNVADRKTATAPSEAQKWIADFEASLKSQDADAAAELFLDDGLWRDVVAFTWTLQTMSGRQAIATALRDTLARTKPHNFSIPAKRTSPRWVSRAGTQAIEAIFEFDTAFGHGNGVVRLVADPKTPTRLRAWTLVTTLEGLRGYEEAYKKSVVESDTRDFGGANWADRLSAQRAYADRDPTVIVVGGG